MAATPRPIAAYEPSIRLGNGAISPAAEAASAAIYTIALTSSAERATRSADMPANLLGDPMTAMGGKRMFDRRYGRDG